MTPSCLERGSYHWPCRQCHVRSKQRAPNRLEPGLDHRTSALHTELQGPAIMNRCEPSWSARHILYEASFGEVKQLAMSSNCVSRLPSAWIYKRHLRDSWLPFSWRLFIVRVFHILRLCYFGSHIHCTYCRYIPTYLNFIGTDALCLYFFRHVYILDSYNE